MTPAPLPETQGTITGAAPSDGMGKSAARAAPAAGATPIAIHSAGASVGAPLRRRSAGTAQPTPAPARAPTSTSLGKCLPARTRSVAVAPASASPLAQVAVRV